MIPRTRRLGPLGLLLLLLGACGPGGQLPGQAQAGAVPSPETGTLTEALTKCAGAHGTLPGVDVSVYQGSINWAQASSSLKWGYAKATEGTGYDDPTFKANWAAMKQEGLARGAYHFFHPSVSGKAQADHYLAQVGAMGAGDLPPMLDWEVTDGVSRATGEANAQAFIDEIHARTGRATVIYTSPGLWPSMSSKSFGTNPLWVADWTYDPSGCPVLPSGWSTWMYWQWTDKGSVPGIGGNVDRDVFNGNAGDLAGAAGGGGTCSGPVGNVVGKAGPVSGPCGGGKPAFTAPPSCGALKPGQGLGPGQSEASCDHRFVLAMQTDGNVVLYAHGIAEWSTATNGKGGAYLVMQTDGNLVLYTSSGCPIWATSSGGNPGAYLAVQSDGNLVVYGASKVLWASGTGSIPPAPTKCGGIPSGDGLGPGDGVWSCGGCFDLTMQSDGNLVLYQKGHGALWSTGTSGKGGYMASMHPGGNLSLYSKQGCTLWSSKTGGHAGAYAALQDDGNLVIYDPAHHPLWSSNTAVCPGGCTCNPPPPPPPPTDGGTPDGGTGGTVDGGTGGTADGGTGGTADGGTGGTADGGTGGTADGGTGGTVDGGTSGTVDGGTGGTVDGGTGGTGGGTVDGGPTATGTAGGCGCSATGGGSPAGLVALLLVGLVLRRRRPLRTDTDR